MQYLEWRFGTPYRAFNIDETVTSEKLAGGFSPITFASGKKEIRYGIITKCLLKRGKYEEHVIDGELKREIVGFGSNLMLDEMNRCPSESIAFLLGFLAPPYTYEIEEENRIIHNPNWRSEFNNEMRWFLCGTMNTMDIGNYGLSSAFKSRWNYIKAEYEATDDIIGHLEIVRELMKLTDYEENIFKDIYANVKTWVLNDDVMFPCGVRHYKNFFTLLRNGLDKLIHDEDKGVYHVGESEVTLSEYIYTILVSSVIMPIINENQPEIVAEKENLAKNYAQEYENIILTHLRAGKELVTILFT